MKYIKSSHSLQPEEGCKIHNKKDYGFRTPDNKYSPPYLTDEVFLAVNLTKDAALGMFEDIELDKLNEYKKEWKKKLKEMEQPEENIEEVQEPELEDFEEAE